MSEDYLQPIETYYKGYRFRSRAEARWAVFFDACNVEWEYEPEGYDLGDGLYYLPDFLVHNVVINHYSKSKKKADLYVEVKGCLTEKDKKKIEKFSMQSVFEMNEDWGGYVDKVINPLFLVGSRIPENFLDTFNEADKLNNEQKGQYFYCLDTVDSSWGEQASFVIDKSGNLTFLSNLDIIVKGLVFEDNTWKEIKDDDMWHEVYKEDKTFKIVSGLDTKNVNIRKTNKAYQMARSARFEFGETPK